MTTSTTAVTPQFVLQPGCTEIEFLGLQFNGIYDDNGEPWFLAHDAANELGIVKHRFYLIKSMDKFEMMSVKWKYY
jgi:prophage antirepressor-like protein